MFAKSIVQHESLSEMARVPLFLWEIARQAKSGSPLPTSRFELLQGMVARACREHRDALRIGGQADLAPRFLTALAGRMSDNSSTAASVSEARVEIATVAARLADEAMFGQPPSPPSILDALTRCHLIILDNGAESVRFYHQLVQEYFASFALAEQVRAEGAASAKSRLMQRAWAVSVELSIAHLCGSGAVSLAADLVEQLLKADFEAACRAIGANPDVWPQVRIGVEARIQELSASSDVNARWLGARFAAATGQSVFAAIVFTGLAGHPPGSNTLYRGIPVEFVFRSLGADFLDRLCASTDEEFRLRAFVQLSQVASSEALDLAYRLARDDSSAVVRTWALHTLFDFGEQDLQHTYLREVRRQGGWTVPLLTVAQKFSAFPIEQLRRRQARLITRLASWKERASTFNRWANSDRSGADLHAKSEYEWCRSQPSKQSFEIEREPAFLDYRFQCLWQAAELEPTWAVEQIFWEISQPGFEKFDAIPWGVVSQARKEEFVRDRIEQLIRDNRPLGENMQFLGKTAPDATARSILRRIASPEFGRLPGDIRWDSIDALRIVCRAALLRVVSTDEFANPSEMTLPVLIDALMRSKPRENSAIPEATLKSWRRQLGNWMEMLPPLDHDSAFIWSAVAMMLGEIADPADASAVIALLRQDQKQECERREQWMATLKAFRASRGTTDPPGPHDACSHQPVFEQALGHFSGPVAAEAIEPLLLEQSTLGFAAHWLAGQIDAPSPEGSALGAARYRYDLIKARQQRDITFAKKAEPIIRVVKDQIDRHLAESEGGEPRDLSQWLVALARLEGGVSGDWILDRIERHFPQDCWDDTLHAATLAGAVLPGARLLPFVERTIHAVRNLELHPVPDQTYRITNIFAALFYSDSPQSAISLIAENMAIFEHKDHELGHLLSRLIWVESQVIDEWLPSFFDDSTPQTVRSAAMLTALVRITRRDASAELRPVVRKFVSLGKRSYSESWHTIASRLAEIIRGKELILKEIIEDAKSARSLNEAVNWLDFLAYLGTEEGFLAALEFAETWGEEHLGVVSSLSPTRQRKTVLEFSGFFANARRNIHKSHPILSKLASFVQSDDIGLRIASERALFWLERERLGGGF